MRSFVRSSLQKSLSQNTIVICDALNYIKGLDLFCSSYRYELFLIAKLCKTTYAVLFCHAAEDTCKWLNDKKDEHLRNRWDSPLFEVNVGKSEKSHCDGASEDMHLDLEYSSPKFVDLPLEDIYKWLCEGTALIENKSTQVVPLAPINFLQELDKVTQEVVSAIVEGQRNTPVGHYIVVTCHQPSENKSNPIDSKSKIASLFINYLNSNT
ncbi:unnamed protein product [Cylicostephanus goldi]|uniref:Protein KTI12 homolog n=1 Tax=Cylicostephanus goldi TaxID=71465 RepID=A0A3P7PT24_CYLGO|nr:unnamed protein product [Cylicostephanus goldi]